MRDLGTSAWREPAFRRFWVGQSLSYVGDQVSAVALPLVAVVVLEATATQLGVLTGLAKLPVVVFGLLIGVWVDRVRRRRLMIMADLARAALLLTIPLAVAAGVASMPLLIVVAVLVASFAVIGQVAGSAFLRSVLPSGRLVDGNARLTQSAALARICGPGLAGVLVQAVTAPVAILVDVISYLASATALATARVEESSIPPPVGRHLGRELREGIAVILRDPLLRASAAAGATYNGCLSAILAVEVLYLSRDLGLPPVAIGLVLAAIGPGALLGSALAARIARRYGIGPTMIIGFAVAGAANLVLPLAFGPQPVMIGMIMVASFGSGLGQPLYNVNQSALRQAIVRPELQGRATATLSVLVGCAAPLGALLGGLIATATGTRTLLIMAALGTVLAGLWLVCSPVRRLIDLPALRQAQGS
ncbi:MFS transporter [Microlunatus parietis]|uniref:MFS family permease n=1 Tax=Microlunatus parietis TaxID=682979 RepID=A0A7Y9I5Y7_9ACTN|nr:MFS transporter [Microlunatus parietis]NYE70901.1 MFS family permease [Microlunatus parietis]